MHHAHADRSPIDRGDDRTIDRVKAGQLLIDEGVAFEPPGLVHALEVVEVRAPARGSGPFGHREHQGLDRIVVLGKLCNAAEVFVDRQGNRIHRRSLEYDVGDPATQLS
jgi:hypothetical protein